jgi:hypothetical protein
MNENEEVYANIRQILGHLVGQRVVDVTQHDRDEWDETGQSYVMIQFASGSWVKFYVGDAGFCDGEG